MAGGSPCVGGRTPDAEEEVVRHALLERSLGRPSAGRSSLLRDRKTVLDTEVHVGSHMDGRRVADFGLPLGTLIVSVTRDGVEIIPDGNTILRGGDELEILTREKDVNDVEDVIDAACRSLAE